MVKDRRRLGSSNVIGGDSLGTNYGNKRVILIQSDMRQEIITRMLIVTLVCTSAGDEKTVFTKKKFKARKTSPGVISVTGFSSKPLSARQRIVRKTVQPNMSNLIISIVILKLFYFRTTNNTLDECGRHRLFESKSICEYKMTCRNLLIFGNETFARVRLL